MKYFKMANKERLKKILDLLSKEYKDARIALDYETDFQLLIAVILSAQCTDERVNKVTPALFKRYPTIKDFAEADIEELEKLIYSTGFYRNKAKNIKGAAIKVMEEFGGELPKTLKEVTSIPGAARKTANVVLNEAHGINEGIVVDTHVARITGKLGLVNKKDAEAKKAVKIERQLMKLIPKEKWAQIPHWLIHHGRKICIARNPKCTVCPLNELCPSAEI